MKPQTEQDWYLIRLHMLDELRQLDILHEYANALDAARQAKQPFHNTEPWHCIAEQLTAAVTVLVKSNTKWFEPNAELEGPNDSAVIAAQLILRATPVMWPIHMELICIEQPMPEHVLDPTILQYPNGLFFSRETCIQTPAHELTDVEQAQEFVVQSNWCMVTQTNACNGIEVWNDNVVSGLTFISRTEYLFNQSVTDDTQHAIRMLAFINSEYVTRTLKYPHRQLMRRNNNHTIIKPAIHVELLRRAHVPYATDSSTHKAIEWQHQWWVRGHWRKQWMPSTKTHKLTYIHPYLKGPEDKPITRKLLKVVR